jgi:hypothetical protein
VYLTDGADPPVFRHVDQPGVKGLQALVERIAARIGRLLEKRGLGRPCRLDCMDWKEITMARHARADSRCTPVSTSSPASARSSNDCVAM